VQGRNTNRTDVSTSGFEPRLVRAAYASIADSYDETYGNDLDVLDLDRSVLDAVAASADARGAVLDVGCGPGHVSRYLTSQGARTVGVDFTPAMLSAARIKGYALSLIIADLLALPIPANAVQAIVAFYVLQHVPRAAIGDALRELRRVLRPQGLLAMAMHEGDGDLHLDQITATLYRLDELADSLTAASFVIESVDHRGPLPHEHQGPRLYLLARAV
jgi:ubiquinone/menaquinone biosynthesis C-methylase UbiE